TCQREPDRTGIDRVRVWAWGHSRGQRMDTVGSDGRLGSVGIGMGIPIWGMLRFSESPGMLTLTVGSDGRDGSDGIGMGIPIWGMLRFSESPGMLTLTVGSDGRDGSDGIGMANPIDGILKSHTTQTPMNTPAAAGTGTPGPVVGMPTVGGT